MKQLSYKKGFTLVEILVAVALLGIFSVAVSQVFFTLIRSQNKTEKIQTVKEAGDYAFNVMETMIRNAKSINATCPSSTANSVVITNPDGENTTFECLGDPDFKISSESASGIHSSFDLTGENILVDSCNFTIVCPASSSTPEYVFFTYAVKSKLAPTGDVLQNASEVYQGTVGIRN